MLVVSEYLKCRITCSLSVGNDYNSEPYTVTIPAGDNMRDFTFSVTIIDDDIREMSETFNLIIDPSSLPNGVTSSNNATVTILDHDGEGSKDVISTTYMFFFITVVHVMFSKAIFIFKEGMEQNKVLLNLILSKPSSTDIILKVQSTDLTTIGMNSLQCSVVICVNTGDIDYASGSYNVILPAKMTEVSFNVSILGDNILENNETFKLNIIDPQLSQVAIRDPSQATVIIEDDDGRCMTLITC